MTLSRLSVQSIELLADFNAKFFSDGWNLNQLRGAFGQVGFNCIGAFDGKELVGYISYSLTDGVADLDDVVVCPDYRRRGLGYRLVCECFADLTKKGAGRILLEVRKGNQNAISLYAKAGFTKISVRKKYYSNGEDALVYQKELK